MLKLMYPLLHCNFTNIQFNIIGNSLIFDLRLVFNYQMVYTHPVINAAKQNIVRIMPYFLCLTSGIANSTMYSIDVKPKLYTKSVPSVEYDNAKPQNIEEIC